MAKKIAKVVYLNPDNPKEKEIAEWINSNFLSFGGMVKELLYAEMLRGQNTTPKTPVNKKIENKDKDIKIPLKKPIFTNDSKESKISLDNSDMERFWQIYK